jgi:hypothetical protein
MRRLVIGLLCLPALVACSHSGPVPPGNQAWVTYQADVTAVRTGADPYTLLLTVSLLAGTDGCSRNPRITYFIEENERIFANVVQDSRVSQVDGACPGHTPGVVTLTAPDPINGRTVVLNQQAWKSDGDGYHRCDQTLGCDPMPADHCDTAWIHVAVAGLDVSRHSAGTVERCDGKWLVMTVPFDPVPCGAEPRAGCDPAISTRRYFLRWGGPYGWRVIASSAQAGCGTVLTVEPTFPSTLCDNLPKPS